jgi:hypothetical protein
VEISLAVPFFSFDWRFATQLLHEGYISEPRKSKGNNQGCVSCDMGKNLRGG